MAYYRRRYRPRRKTSMVKRRPRYYKRNSKAKRMNKASIQKVPGLTLADRTFLKMAFTQTFVATFTASAAPQFFTFSGVNLNDPSNTLGTLRPSGWTQWAAMYNQFRVYGSSITVKFMSAQDPTLPSVMRVVVLPHQGATGTAGFADVDTATSQKYAKNRVYNATTTFPTIRHSIGTAKLAGVNKESIRDEATTYSGSFASAPAGPNNENYWFIGVQPLASTTTTVNIQVRVVYSVELYNRKEFNQP